MATLTNTKIKDTYDGLLKTTDNDVIGASEKVITDGLGNASVLSIGTASASFSSDIEVNGLTIGKGNGSLSTNVAFGVNALDSVTYGVDNTAMGHSTMQNITGGVDNAAFGTGAMFSTTTGNNNTSIGSASLPVNTTGSSNTAVGLHAMQVNTTGGANTVVGMNALNDNTEGNRNTTLGFGSGNGIITGSDNIHIGYNTTSGATDVSNEIVIGSNVTGNGSNTATYGDSNITDHYFTAGQVNVTGNLAVDTNTLYVDASSNEVGINTSSPSYALDINASTAQIQTAGATSLIFRDTGWGNITIGHGALSVGQGKFAIGGASPSFIVDAANNRVGIGTSSPTYPMQLTGAGDTTFGIEAGATSLASLNLGNSTNLADGGIRYDNSTDTLIFRANNAEKMRIDSSGRVGIGESSPSAKLTVNVTSDGNSVYIDGNGTQLAIGSSSSTNYINSQNGNATLAFQTNGSERMRIDSSGNVGIGAVPSFPLHLSNTTTPQFVIQNTAGGTNAEKMAFEMGAGDVFKIKSLNDNNTVRVDNILALNAINGNVGIGLSNPSFKLDIKGAGAAIRVEESGGAEIRTAAGGSQGYFGTYSNHPMSFLTNASEKMRIDSSGNVGIGGSPTTKLDVFSSGSALRLNSLDGNGSYITFANNSTSKGYIGSAYHLLSSPSNSANDLAIRAEENLLFSSGGTTERMRITSGGFLKASNTGTYVSATGGYHEMVGTSDDNYITLFRNFSTVPYGIQINYPNFNTTSQIREFLSCSTSGGDKLKIWGNGDVDNANNAYGALSDAKLKENIVDASPKLDDLMQVKIRNYNLIGDDKKQLGVVAQELEEVFPSLVETKNDFEEQEVIDEEGNVTKERVDLGTTTKSVKYSVFVPMLIKAIQELNAKVEQLESQLNA